MNARSIVRGFARNNAWANYRLYAACALLTPEELHAKRTSFFPTIMMTLNHNLIVDWYYLDALAEKGRGRSVFAGGDEPFAELAPLREAQRTVDRELVSFVDAMSDDGALDKAVSLERPEGVKIESAGDVLLHLFEHQIHHRGQAHAMLAGTNVKPPQLDEFFLRQDLALREHDLEALGLPPGP
jgi:uncharacterized damage-inducible protein DinB